MPRGSGDSILIRVEREGERVEVRALIRHPMETGRRRAADGRLVPAHYIERLVCEHDGRTVLDAHWGTGISRNPFVALRLRGARSGDALRLSWVDNRGGSDEVRLELP